MPPPTAPSPSPLCATFPSYQCCCCWKHAASLCPVPFPPLPAPLHMPAVLVPSRTRASAFAPSPLHLPRCTSPCPPPLTPVCALSCHLPLPLPPDVHACALVAPCNSVELSRGTGLAGAGEGACGPQHRSQQGGCRVVWAGGSRLDQWQAAAAGDAATSPEPLARVSMPLLRRRAHHSSSCIASSPRSRSSSASVHPARPALSSDSSCWQAASLSAAAASPCRLAGATPPGAAAAAGPGAVRPAALPPTTPSPPHSVQQRSRRRCS